MRSFVGLEFQMNIMYFDTTYWDENQKQVLDSWGKDFEISILHGKLKYIS